MAKVSIVVPIYNVEKYLPKCLDSLINQTFNDIEILAISDGSPDNSVEIIKKYQKKDNRVKCIEKENGGYGSVLEYAIKNIKSEYFLICDPDDWLRLDAIEILYDTAKKNKLDFVYGSYYYVYSNDLKEEYTSGVCFENIYSPKNNEIIEQDIFKLLFLAPNPHAKLYKTDLAKNIVFPHKVSFTDFTLYALFIPKVKKAAYLTEGLAYYLIDRVGNTTTDVKPKVIDYHCTVFESIWNQYSDYDNKNNMFYLRMFLQCIFINNQLARITNKDDYLTQRKKVYNLFLKCHEHKKEIISCLDLFSRKEKIQYKLLLNRMSSYIAFLYFSKKLWKNNK